MARHLLLSFFLADALVTTDTMDQATLLAHLRTDQHIDLAPHYAHGLYSWLMSQIS